MSREHLLRLALAFCAVACGGSFEAPLAPSPSGAGASVDTNASQGSLEALVNMGADFNVAGSQKGRGLAGFRLEVFQWRDKSRVGVEVGALNTTFCEGESCGAGRGEYMLPFGVEADTFYIGESMEEVTAFGGAGLRFIVYSPPPGGVAHSPWALSPQLALRMGGSYGGPRSLRLARNAPAGFTLDHAFYVGPSLMPETGGTALLIGYSLGVGVSD